VAELVDAL